MVTLTLPRLVGSDETANDLVDELLEHKSLVGAAVTINFRECRAITQTFLRRLFLRLAVSEQVESIHMEHAAEWMILEARRAAARMGLEDYLVAGAASEDDEHLWFSCICGRQTIARLGCLCGSAMRKQFLANRRRHRVT